MNLLKAQSNNSQIISNQYNNWVSLKNKLIILNILRRFFKGDLIQRLGRFLLVRKTYSFLKRSQQYFCRQFYSINFQEGYQCVINNIKINDFVAEVDENSVSFGLSISTSMVEEIFYYANYSPCSEPGYNHFFCMQDLDEYNFLPDGHRVIRALVADSIKCPAINIIAKDSLLLQIASAYLSYYPTQVTSHLTWSIDCNFVQDVHEIYPVSNFHYDIAGYNFATAYFYITSIHDENSGPHIMIKKSHKKKPIWSLLKSGPYSDETIYDYYGKENAIQIMGEAGFGFFQDPSCFHKLKVPLGKNRLLLQIRYA